MTSVADVSAAVLARHGLRRIRCKAKGGYDFAVPLLAGDHVTDDAGTGFVHTAPGHGREDFEIWTANARDLEARGINTAIPYTVDENGAFTAQAPGFDRQARHQRQGREGRRQRGGDQGAGRGRQHHRARPPQASVSAFVALEEAGDLPQHAAVVHRDGQGHRDKPERHAARSRARTAIKATRWVPPQGENRITGMIESAARLGDLAPARLGRADRGVRQGEGRRLGDILKDETVEQRIADAFEQEGADAWYKDGARERFLGKRANEAGRRSTTFSTSGSTPARRTPSCWKTRSISRSSAGSSARPTAGRTR